MNWDRIEGQWKQRRGKAVHHWGKLMNDELAAIAGKHEQVVGMLQEKYGIAKEQVKRHVTEYNKIMSQLKKANANLMKLKNDTSQKKSVKKTTAAGAQRSTARRRKAKTV
jgi:uncharacterized protein YjbJ (UPF0337 family)